MSLTIKTAMELQAETQAACQARLAKAIDTHVEVQARSLGYSSAVHLAGYAGSTVARWQTEAQAFVAWRDQVWQTAIHIMDQANPADPPSAEAVLARLPVWPG